MIEFFQQLPAPIAIFFLAMLPIFELRLAIPMGLIITDLPIWQVFFFAVVGNLLPALFIIWFIRPVSEWLCKHFKFFQKFFDWWFCRVVKKFEGKYLKYGKFALILFVAIPLPITGAWTGSVASFLFKIPRKDAMILVTIGVLIAGVVVTALATGAFALAKTL